MDGKGGNHAFFGGGENVPEVIAHRGGAGEWPGETIYAFDEAVKMGVDILEMDIRYTSDDVPVLMHNSTVLETTGVDKRVKDFTADEIQRLDAAYWWRRAGKVFPPGAELGVPRLEDVLKRFPGRRMVIEIKPHRLPIELIKKFCALLRHHEMTRKVLVASACPMNLFFFRRECPEAATSASVPELLSFRALKSFGYKPDCVALQLSSKAKAGPLHLHFITRRYIDKAHELDLKVHGWTVNEAEEMGRLISLKVDGIITDYPTTLLKFLGRI